MYSGVVPQQPPKILTPKSAWFCIYIVKSSGVISYSLVTGFGRPALALIIIGRLVHLDSSSMIGNNSLGPSEQFTPIASTPRPSRVNAIADIEQPVKVLPFSSKVMVHIIGRLEFSLAHNTADFNSYKSVIVSKTIKSASLPAEIISL